MTFPRTLAILLGLVVVPLAPPGGLFAQPAVDLSRKEIRASRANPHPPHVDGKLDDPAWASAKFTSDFVQKEPVEGAPPTESTQVAIVYDDDALYIGARCFSRKPGALRRHLDRRDRQGPAEQFIVTIDSYLDRRTAYGFGVNTAGVRFDRYNPEDNEYSRDFTYDPVWSARSLVDSVSWTTEMRIPFSQLRFTDKTEQIWGINFNRWVPGRNEDIYWIYVPRDATGWASRFGHLTGISGIAPSRRIELLPYTASSLSARTGQNPITEPTDKDSRAGGDLKMGLGPNLTLDATFNPDFGQVEADPAVVNLSAYETVFSERRPFFLEGSQLLAGSGPNYYYSRRIGARSRILGAGKITGRLQSGTSVGFLSAVTERDALRLEPATAYAVGRLQQQFGPDQSTVGISVAAVERELSPRGELDAAFRKGAVSGGADWELRFQEGMYRLSGHLGASRIRGSRQAILSAQESSARYFQRPDADYVSLDSTRTSLAGYSAALELGKNAGKHWLWNLASAVESPGFDLNDAGQLASADEAALYGRLAYRETEPGRLLRSYILQLESYGEWNYGAVRQYSDVNYYSEVTWKNFWNTWLFANHQFPGQDDSRTRGGPSMKRESGDTFGGGFRSNFAAPTQYSGSATLGFDDLDGWLYRLQSSVSTRLGTRTQLSIAPYYQREDQPRQYVSAEGGALGGAGTFGTRYIFARIAQTTIALEMRTSYFFTPDLSLELYAQPFAASGRYYGYGELVTAGDIRLRVYEGAPDADIRPEIDSLGRETGSLLVTDSTTGTQFRIGRPDFNFVSFRSNLVLRWEFHPGSTLFLVWQRNLSNDFDTPRRARAGDILDSFGAPGYDFFGFKLAYWLPLS